MTAYSIILVACLLAEPTHCRNYEKMVQLSASPSAAYVQAQTMVADWLKQHPGFGVRAWRVELGRSA